MLGLTSFLRPSALVNLTGYDLLQDDFGLLDKSPTNWRNLTAAIQTLNLEANATTSYKLFYVARHGQGWHNVGESKYGTPAWDSVRLAWIAICSYCNG